MRAGARALAAHDPRTAGCTTYLPGTDRTCRADCRFARQMRWRVGEALALMHVGAHLSELGEYGRALDALEASLGIAAEIDHQECLVHANATLGALYLELLCLPEAIKQLQQAVERACQTGLVVMVGSTTSLLVRAYVQQQNFEQAEAALAQGRILYAAATEPALGERQLRRAALELALTLYLNRKIYVPRALFSPGILRCNPSLSLIE